MKFTSRVGVFLVVAICFSNQVASAALIGFEDLDGGHINLLSTTNVFDFGSGGGASGDVFGRVSNFAGGGTGMPFDVADDTVTNVSGGGVFTPDVIGLAGGATSAFFAMNDMDGPSAPGFTDATWRFDISSAVSITNIQIDIGALGDFDTSPSDGFRIEARVDANAFQIIFDTETDEAAFKTYRLRDIGTAFAANDPLELFIDGDQNTGVSAGFLDKSDANTGAFDTYTSTGLGGSSGSTLDVKVSWTGSPSGSEPMGIDNITINGIVPEPSGLTVAALCLLGLLGCGWRRRRSSTV